MLNRVKASDPDLTLTKTLEEALAGSPRALHHVLRLFVSGSTPRTVRAIKNIRALCEEQLRDRYELEIVDIYQHPEQARPEQIVAVPTLVKKLPLPLRQIIGDMSDTEKVLVGLDILVREVQVERREEEGDGR
jgi:circadian clock protein KaiB